MSPSSSDELKQLLSRNNRTFIHFNSRSFRKNHDGITNFLSSLDHSFSFISLSETWLTPADCSLYSINSYNAEFCHRPNNNHGGSAIFISANIAYTRRCDLSLDVTNCESVWVEMNSSFLALDSSNFVLGSIYRSPSSPAQDFIRSLDSILHKLSSENKHVIIMGDMNINLLDIHSTLYKQYTDCFTGYGFECLINCATRHPAQGSHSLIDHALCNLPNTPISGVVEANITDHYPIFIVLKADAPCHEASYSASVFNEEKFVEVIGDTDWSLVKAMLDPVMAVNSFYSAFLKAVTLSTTTVNCKRKYKQPCNPWVTESLLMCMRKKDNLYKKLKKQPFNNLLQLRYKKYSNVLSNLLKQAKKRYYEKALSQSKFNAKKKWKLLNDFLNRRLPRSQISTVNHNDTNYHKPSDIANAFCDYFSLPQPPPPLAALSIPRRTPHSFFLCPVSSEEVHVTITQLKTTSPGLDNISMRHLKLVARLVSDPICHIINLIFQSGVFPEVLKRSKIIPVFKKGNKDRVTNYRPISILSSFSKLIEKLFCNRLNNYLTKFNLINSCQFGFRSGSSTSLALISLLDYVKHSLDKSLFVGSVFLDFTKAFDTINHDILFSKLQSYGISGPPLTFLKSYLLDRQYVVYAADAFSEAKTSNQGVPQGSILGPLLFLLYINDLPNIVGSSHCVLYADDTTVSMSDKCLSSLTNKLNYVLNNILDWGQKNHLIINPAKTKFMIFRSGHRLLPKVPSLRLGSATISPCDCTTFLGIRLDCHLKFNYHINHLKTVTAFGIRALIKARNYFPISTLLSLYFSFIHSHLNYGIIAWVNTYKYNLHSVQHIQNQALRIITNSSVYNSSTLLQRKFNILSICRLFQYNIAVMFFKLINNQLTFPFIDGQCLCNTNSTRFALQGNFLLPTVRTDYGKRSAHFASISMWNTLPLHLKLGLSISAFKKALKDFLLQN